MHPLRRKPAVTLAPVPPADAIPPALNQTADTPESKAKSTWHFLVKLLKK